MCSLFAGLLHADPHQGVFNYLELVSATELLPHIL
jgi:hypothetical protein